MKPSVSHLEAIGLAVAGFTLFVLADTSIKIAGRSLLPAHEIVAFQGFFTTAFLILYGLLRRNVRDLWPQRPRRLLVRSCLDLCNNFCVVIALRHLPLTLFYILVFASPIVIAILATCFLRERMDLGKAAAILTGFSGVVIAVDPFGSGSQGDWIGYAACAICVGCFATSMVWSRVITQSEGPESITFFSGLVMSVAGSGAMLWQHGPLNLRLLTVLFAMGVCCTVGSICFFTALKHTTAANVSQYHYTQLVSGSLITYVIWQQKPTLPMLVGGVLIIASGIYVALRTRSRIGVPGTWIAER
jgi:drug/metabolite transporter (DMT)-like permease